MIDLPPKPRRIWLRSFYEFGPEDDGYIGWTEEGPRDRMLGLIEDGDLFVIYGASSAETEKSHRNRVLGFLQVEARAIKDVDRASAVGMQRKRANGWQDKWTYALPVVRAWRSNESVLLERISEINGGFPPAAIGKWTMQLISEPYDGRKAAEVAEQAFKVEAAKGLQSLGGEFFRGDLKTAQGIFATVPGVSRFGR